MTERKRRDLAARGHRPRDRVAPPELGERCPRCHSVCSLGRFWPPCALCAPLSPAAVHSRAVAVAFR